MTSSVFQTQTPDFSNVLLLFSLRPTEPQGHVGDLFDITMFQYKQSRKKVKSLWGREQWEEWFVLLGIPTLNPKGVGWAQNASMAGKDGTKDDTVHGPGTKG